MLKNYTLQAKLALLIITLSLSFFTASSGQSFRFGYLFAPGATIGGEYAMPATVNDSLSFDLARYRAQLTIPLKTKVKTDLNFDKLKKLDFSGVDLKARQDFLMFNYGQRYPGFEGFATDNQNIHTVSVGYTGISAGLRKGIWIYSANIYLAESAESFGTGFRPNALLYGVRVRLNNLKFIYFYGAGAVYNFGQFLPVPIFGFTNKIGKNLRLTAILPVQVSLSYKLSKTFKVEQINTLSGFNPVYVTAASQMNFRHVKSNITFLMKLDKGFSASLEGGYSWWRGLNVYDKPFHFQSDFDMKPAPYLSLNINYNLGRGLLESKLEGVD